MQRYCTRILQSSFILFFIFALSIHSQAQLAISVNGGASVQGCGSSVVSHLATNPSKTIIGVVWTLGTGNNSTNNPASAIYGVGTYSISVTATYSDGTSETTTANNIIDVFEPPVPTFTTSGIGGCAPTTITFTNTTALPAGATSFVNILWEFSNNGSVIGTASGANPNFTFNVGGDIDVRLFVRDNNGCTGSALTQDALVIVEDLNANFTPNNNITTCNASQTVNFTNTTTTIATGPIDYLWNFGDGTTSTDENPSHTFNGPGAFTVSMTATHVESYLFRYENTK